MRGTFVPSTNMKKNVSQIFPYKMNTLKRIALYALLLLCSAHAAAQSWERVYTNLGPVEKAEFRKILPAADGGFLLLVGEEMYNAAQADIRLVKIDAQGNQLWVRKFDTGAAEWSQDLIATSDGGYALLYRTAPNALDTRSHVMKLDAAFNIVYLHELAPGGPANNLRGKQLLEVQQKLYVFGTSHVGDLDINTGFIYRLDLFTGTQEAFQELLPKESELRAAVPTPDGRFLVLNDGYDPDNQSIAITVMKVNNQTGAVDWTADIGENGMPYLGRDIIQAPNGDYLISGSWGSQGLLAQIAADGTPVWLRKYNSFVPGIDSLNILGLDQLSSDGFGIWAVGATSSYIPQIVLVRFDPFGNILIQKKLGIFFHYNYAFDVLALPDGGALLAGARSLSQADTDFAPYAIRVNADGLGYMSGVSGKITFDFENDCVGDVDTILYGFGVNAWRNGALMSSGTADNFGNYHIALDTGQYQIVPAKPNNAWSFCPDTIPVSVSAQDTVENVDFSTYFNPQPIDSVYGYVFEDVDGDCLHDPFETVYPGWSVVVTLYGNGVSYTAAAVTDANGYFNITALNGMLNTSEGNISVSPPPGDGLNCVVSCPDALYVQFPNSNAFAAHIGLQCDSLPPCPLLDVSVATNQLRPCLTSTYTVQYCNLGAVTAQNAEIVIDLDPNLLFTSSSIPWTNVSGTLYTFPLGNVGPEACGNFTIDVTLPCDAPVGATYCVEAHAYPDTICQAPGANWDGSEIEVSVGCDPDSVRFTIRNVGLGDMQQMQEYIVIEDNVLLMQAPGEFQIDAGEEVVVSLPATGAFYRLEAEQSPGFPGLNMPAAWVEGCAGMGGNVNLGFVNQYPLPDQEPWIDIFCLESVNSYDPNDKNGFPRGYGAERYIEPNTELEYLIRFQNTGTAPALYVEIRDTLDITRLVPASVRPGASSHDYEWDMQGNGVVVFRFPNINLPDTSVSQELSQGFVKFRVQQQPDLPGGTKIHNRAAIYFDNNDPIITNKTLHTIGLDFIIVDTDGPPLPGAVVRLQPNPALHWVTVVAAGLPTDEPLLLRLYNRLGQTELEVSSPAAPFGFDARGLMSGVYFYEVLAGDTVVGRGKLVKVRE